MDPLEQAVLALIQPMVDAVVAREVDRAVARRALADPGERLFTVRVAAERLCMGETTLRRHIAEGRLKVVAVPGRVPGSTETRVRGVDLDTFVRRLAGERDDQRPQPSARSSRVRQPVSNPPRLSGLVQRRLRKEG